MARFELDQDESREIFTLFQSAKTGVEKLEYVLMTQDIGHSGSSEWTRNRVCENIRQIRSDLSTVSNIIKNL